MEFAESFGMPLCCYSYDKTESGSGNTYLFRNVEINPWKYTIPCVLPRHIEKLLLNTMLPRAIVGTLHVKEYGDYVRFR